MFATRTSVALAVFALALAAPASAVEDALAPLARRAVDPDERVSVPAIAALRAHGPVGLAALLTEHGPVLARWFPHAPGPDAPEWNRLRHALDRVAGQHAAHASRLYWYTDLDAARAAARAARKPILSLRLLGRLDEAESCANSRFFRVALYPHPGVAQALRNDFVLHWSSERPVPIVTIDFGDGRKLRRPIVGNSAHLVLDPDGRPVSAIPGLMTPTAFTRELELARGVALTAWRFAPAPRARLVAGFHADRLASLRRELAGALRSTGGAPVPAAMRGPLSASPTRPRPPGLPRAAEAGALAASKAAIQMPVLTAIGEGPAPAGALAPAQRDRLAEARAAEARLHPTSLALMRGHMPPGATSSEAFAAVVAGFQRQLARDTVTNVFELLPKVHEAWLRNPVPPSFDAWNARLYADVFLMPRGDAWAGLLQPDVYTALPDAGVVPKSGRRPAP